MSSQRVYAVGFSFWKRAILKKFLRGKKICFVSSPLQISKGSLVVLWGSLEPTFLPKEISIIRVEDGFLRSKGLGALLTKPFSWVLDDVGIYYDATRPSALELMLSKQMFNQKLLCRAQNFKEKLIAFGVDKYNLGGKPWVRKSNKRVLLVVGQVPNDASIRLGAQKIQSNLELLKKVRKKNPDAMILYKPHPDILASLRKEEQKEESFLPFCDEVIKGVDTLSLLSLVDEVHTMTSLLGFEALIRGVSVFCYGMPFYAGWGLTSDEYQSPRRKRKLLLNELVASSLLLYPSYISLKTGERIEAEDALEELFLLKKTPISMGKRLLFQVLSFVLQFKKER